MQKVWLDRRDKDERLVVKLPTGFSIKDPPWYNHQWLSFIYGLKHEQAGILLDLGLGKTRVGIELARYRLQQKEVKRILVICPPTIMSHWESQIKKWSDYDSTILHAPLREDRLYLFGKRDAPFFIINYEALHRYLPEVLDLNSDMILFDESARYLKGHSSQRTLASIEIADITRYKYLLTGRLLNKPTDIWPQFRVLDWGRSFSREFYKFRSKYFEKKERKNYKKWVLKDGAEKILNNIIFQQCIKIKKEECYDLPPQIFSKIEVSLGELEDIYNGVKKKVLSEIETLEGPIQLQINNILTKLLKLQQVTSGFIKTGNKESKLKITPKLDALIDQTEEVIDVKESVIIFCYFRFSIHMIEEILKKKKIKYISMTGSDSRKIKGEKWKRFQLAKEIPVFISQIVSGGIGIELFKIGSEDKHQHTFFYEHHTYDARDQAIGRSHRLGQKSICRYLDFIVKNTYDERKLEIIKEDMSIADAIESQGVKKFLEGGT